ncbi:hypothetical protein J7E95_17940 [Streptomyces sp. ISL-14]|nr:hypothetical protein [Streptomyces sp. ISL-14]
MLKATNNDIEKVRRLAGHSNITTSALYLKDSYSDLADAVDARNFNSVNMVLIIRKLSLRISRELLNDAKVAGLWS